MVWYGSSIDRILPFLPESIDDSNSSIVNEVDGGVGGEAKEQRAKEGSWPSEKDVDSPPARKEIFLSDPNQFFPKRDK
jgi:hypothetical protein